jgi:hypothetical protein
MFALTTTLPTSSQSPSPAKSSALYNNVLESALQANPPTHCKPQSTHALTHFIQKTTNHELQEEFLHHLKQYIKTLDNHLLYLYSCIHHRNTCYALTQRGARNTGVHQSW